MPVKKASSKGAGAKAATARDKKPAGFSDAEKEAMRARARELKASANKAEGEKAVRKAIAAMPQPSRGMGERLHAIITANAPSLTPRTWYGMPAYANENGVVLFFRNADKFKERYLTLGFNDEARLDDGHMWPVAFALTSLTAADEARIAALVKKAVS